MSTSGGGGSHGHSLAQRVQSALRENRLADAAQLVVRLRAEAPDDPNADLFGGIVAYKQERFTEAIAQFENVRRLHPIERNGDVLAGECLASRRPAR